MRVRAKILSLLSSFNDGIISLEKVAAKSRESYLYPPKQSSGAKTTDELGACLRSL